MKALTTSPEPGIDLWSLLGQLQNILPGATVQRHTEPRLRQIGGHGASPHSILPSFRVRRMARQISGLRSAFHIESKNSFPGTGMHGDSLYEASGSLGFPTSSRAHWKGKACSLSHGPAILSYSSHTSSQPLPLSLYSICLSVCLSVCLLSHSAHFSLTHSAPPFGTGCPVNRK